ncbi:MAG: hypothetical protein PHW60_05545 [Kiritimatiellae bacterium]|nr:hypothetical protein [Kiritimatiellia bacterium]
MGEASGDQQARAELLAKLLVASGERPYLLKHGEGKTTYQLIMVPMKDEELPEWTKTLGSTPLVIPFGPLKLMPLPLEKNLKAGSLEKRLYDPAAGGWSATIAVMRFK